MKYILFLLLPFTALGQNFVLQDGTKMYIPEDIWKNAIHVNTSTPKEIQFEPGVQVKFIIVEVPNGGKTIRIGEATAPVPSLVLKQTIDDPDFFYSVKNATVNSASGTMWNTFSGQPWNNAFHNKTGTFSNALNTFAEITFTGKRAVLYGEVSSNKGIAGISVDGKPEVEKDLYGATGTNNSQVVFDTGILPQGNHTLKVRVTGKKNPASSGAYILVDKVEIFE